MLTSTESPQLSSSFGQAGDDSPNLNSRTAKKGIRVEEAPRDRSSFYADLLKFHSIKGFVYQIGITQQLTITFTLIAELRFLDTRK